MNQELRVFLCLKYRKDDVEMIKMYLNKSYTNEEVLEVCKEELNNPKLELSKKIQRHLKPIVIFVEEY